MFKVSSFIVFLYLIKTFNESGKKINWAIIALVILGVVALYEFYFIITYIVDSVERKI